MEDRKCASCGSPMSFKTFLRNNPQMGLEKAEGYWIDKYIAPVCPNCFFNAEEKPYKKNRRELNRAFIQK